MRRRVVVRDNLGFSSPRVKLAEGASRTEENCDAKREEGGKAERKSRITSVWRSVKKLPATITAGLTIDIFEVVPIPSRDNNVRGVA